MSKKLDQSIFKGKDKKWQWAAIDAVNSVPTLFTHKPEKSKLFDFYMNAEGEYYDLRGDIGYNTKNWQDSLIEREGADKIARDILKESIEILESGIAMNWSDMKKIETRLNREMSGMQTKLNELCLQVDGQQRQIHLAAESIGSNKQAISKIENKSLKQLDQSVFEGLDKKWRFAAVDRSGEVWAYNYKPNYDSGYWFVEPQASSGMAVGADYDASNWKNSLIEREAKLKTLDQSVFEGLDEKWKWLGVNSDGTLLRATQKPRTSVSRTAFVLLVGNSEVFGEGYDTSNWQDSLIERESEVELTGSDLTRALKKERDWVLAYVSNENDVTAEFHQRAVIVTGITDKGDFICSGGRWRYAVPVSHNGKILSAKEV